MMILLIVGCTSVKERLQGTKDTKGVDTSLNICTSDVKVFTFSEEVLMKLSRDNKENALQINCMLHKCGYSVPNPDLCDALS